MTPLHEAAETAFALGQTELAAAIRAGEQELRAELEAAKKNDARYRWLRDGELGPVPKNDDFPFIVTSSTRRHLWRDEADAAIDAEMAKDSAHAAYMAASNALGQEL